MAGEPGASAQLEYQRRREQDRRRRRDNLVRSLVIVLLTPAVVYALVTLVGVPLFNRQLHQGLQRLTSTVSEPAADADANKAVDDRTAHTLGLLLAGGATVSMAAAAWGRRQSTESWGIGAAGERRTAAVLEPLTRRGFVLLHDRQLAGGRANIDHIAVGPTGVFVIETKNLTGRVVIGRKQVRHNGRPIGAVDQARREAEAVAVALGDEPLRRLVRPIVCIHGAEVQTNSWWTSTVVNGVLICSGGRLRRAVKRGKQVLAPAEVAALAGRLDAALRPAAPAALSASHAPPAPRCRCGAAMVLRTRRHDGSAFWGCSRYPRCRQTRPATTG